MLPVHKLKNRAKVLLSSVFGPYAQDDEYGSREINPMELYQNQVTRVQNVFSLRMFHRSFGLLMIQENIDAPCTLLDFPTLDRFIEEIKTNAYDIIGVGAIIPNWEKVKKMCELVRKYQPNAVIVVGGHVANKEQIDTLIDSDHIVKGDGVRWFRRYLGQDENAKIKHPMVLSGFGSRILGCGLSEEPGETAAILVPSVGCPVGCNFCSTSAFFGGKGNFVNFYESGDELFEVMCEQEKKLGVRSFFILDENFLLHRKRALRLLDLMIEHEKSWALMVFSSARVVKSYTMEQLIRLGVIWVWMGIEGESSQYSKLKDVDTHELIRTLQQHGIRVLGSTIVGLETHTPDTIDDAIEYAVGHNTDFHQFMLYTPNPGTPLYEEHKRDGSLFPESKFPAADTHGQYRFNYRHKHIPEGEEEKYLLKAFHRDFEINGPSLARLVATMLKGWRTLKHHPDPCVRDRIRWDTNPIRTVYAGAVWAMKQWYRGDSIMYERMDHLLNELCREFGIKTVIASRTFGVYAYAAMKLEKRRLDKGWKYEPQSFYEKNAVAPPTSAQSGSESGNVSVCTATREASAGGVR